MAEISKQSPEKEQPLRAPDLLRMLGRAATYAYTGLRNARNKPPTLFRVLEEEVADSPQLLHPDIATIINTTHKTLERHTIDTPKHFSLSDKLVCSIRMIQFTDQFAGSEQAFFEYSTMKELKDHFTARAQQQEYPLSFDQQLDVALTLANDDAIEALTNLWFCSRQYGRWLDSVSIRNLPELTPEEVLEEMKEWRSSILACKNADENNFQDTAGDTYYAWTHALSRVIYGSGTGISDRLGKYIFSRGTDIMHIGVRTFTGQSVPSNHRIAAEYGNRIGDTILDAIKKRQSLSSDYHLSASRVSSHVNRSASNSSR